jgi:hypothetical protein
MTTASITICDECLSADANGTPHAPFAAFRAANPDFIGFGLLDDEPHFGHFCATCDADAGYRFRVDLATRDAR